MINKKSIYKLILISTSLIIIGLIGFVLLHYSNEIRRREENEKNISSSIAPDPISVTTNFAKKIADGSPLVFGGSHLPPLEHEGVYSKLAETGVTSLRQDLVIPYSLPRNITIDEYRQNTNNVKDPANWDKKTIPTVLNSLREAKKNGINTIGVLAYAPKWLTYDGTPNGVIKDKEVYKDIVKKIYKMYRNDLDYLEIGNEPDHSSFLKTTGTSQSRETAYKEMYAVAYAAIREVDTELNDGKRVKIGAGVESNPMKSVVLRTLLDDSELRSKYPPDFISFHSYDFDISEPLKIYKDYSDNYFGGKIPIFITEWNYESRSEESLPFKSGDEALTFTASRFIEYLENSIKGASYFNMLPLNVKNVILGPGEQTMGFYLWNDNDVVLLPQAKSWHLMSSKMSLGKGASDIFDTKVLSGSEIRTLGFINKHKEQGIVLVNSTDSQQFIEVHLKNLKTNSSWQQLQIYSVDSGHDGKIPLTEVVYTGNGEVIKKLYLEPKSVAGILLQDNLSVFEKMKHKLLSL